MKKIKDFATGKMLPLSPEESVRQEYERILVEDYSYKKMEIGIEVLIPRGTGAFPDRADIVIFKNSSDRDPTSDILGIVEVKRPHKKEGLEQLKSYMTATSAIWGVWTNGDDIAYICRIPGTNSISEHWLNNIPAKGQTIENIGRIKKTELKPFGRSELKSAFRRILRRLYANANISRREKLGGEMIKLIFSKIEDEKTYLNRLPDFRAEAGEDPHKVKNRIIHLFERVKRELKDDNVFSSDDSIGLDAPSTAWVVGQLERSSLLKTDTDVVGDSFEIFAESRLAGEKGEFFTPRGVVDLAVRLTDPQPEETVCDPACGSGGFLIHAMRRIWQKMDADPRWKNSPKINELKQQAAAQSLFGIDKENDLVKIAKAYMAIAGDGRSNIVHENALHDPKSFSSSAKQKFVSAGRLKTFNVILTNPPFGSKIRVTKSDSANFNLGHVWKKDHLKKWIKGNKVCERDPYVLFIERCLDILSEKGRLAIVLPETVFHAPKTEYLRYFINKKACIKAVIELPHNAFRPHCNAKACLLILEKGPYKENHHIIMAAPEEMGHDHQGRILYHPQTGEIWDDLPLVAQELERPGSKENRFVFQAPRDIIADNLIPSYYKGLLRPPKAPVGQKGVLLGQIVKEGILGAWDGHGSPSAGEKGRGNVPYIRVADIVNWELYRNPVSSIPLNVYEKMTKNKRKIKAEDILFVRRGSFRIGTVAMASPRDENVLLTREILTFRVLKENSYGIDAFYLLWLLSSEFVQKQIKPKVFIDTTLPNIGGRWREIILPIHKDREKLNKISLSVKKAIRQKWKSQEEIQKIRDMTGSGIVT